MDAFRFLDAVDQRFDLILADLPDPNNVLSRLYSREFSISSTPPESGRPVHHQSPRPLRT